MMIISELWIIYGLVFAAALLAVQGAYWLFFQARRDKKAVNRRAALTGQLSSATEVLEALRKERGMAILAQYGVLPKFNKLLVQTGLRINPTLLLFWLVALTLVIYLPLRLFFTLGAIGLPLAAFAALGIIYAYLRLARRRRIRQFSEQFPESLDVVVRGLRAGHPFRTALALVTREMPDPVGSEFGILLDEITFGLDQNAAVANLYDRVGQEDLTFFSIAVNVQSQTGGNLAEILSRLSQLLRQRAKVRMKIRVLTAEGRMSGIFLSATPFVLFLIISLLAPDYFGFVADHPATLPALSVGLALLGLGNIIMYRMVNFKY